MSTRPRHPLTSKFRRSSRRRRLPLRSATKTARSRRSQRTNPARQQRILALALAGVVLLLLLVAGSAILRAERLAQQVAATGQSLMQSQRLAKSVSQALVGNVAAFAEVKDSSDDCDAPCAGPRERRRRPQARARRQLSRRRNSARSLPLVERAEKSAKAVLAQQQILTAGRQRAARHQPPVVRSARNGRDAWHRSSCSRTRALAEISAAGQLVMLTQRIGKSANEFLTGRGREPRSSVPARQGPELVPAKSPRPARRQRRSSACPAHAIRRRASSSTPS